MDYSAVNMLAKELVALLKEEYSFYQSLYIMLDKQKDLVRYNKDEHLLDSFAEIERCYSRVRQSDEKIAALRDRDHQVYKMASVMPEVKKIVNSIVTLVRKNITLVSDSEAYMTKRYERLRSELCQLKNSDKILQYVSEGKPAPQFIDGKE